LSLVDLWKSSPSQLRDKHVQQIISFAGNGKLTDGGTASQEFRSFLSLVPSSLLDRYANECLSKSFDNSGLALQDIVNEVGKRLGFSVSPGRYRGIAGQIGFDGLWKSSEGEHIVVEVKTTDTYRIDLNTIANYRKELIKAQGLTEAESSILMVVGREGTGDLEAQIRGSRHAWDTRLISVEALLRLMRIKEEIDDPQAVRKICNILIPREYTRLDDIIDVVFSTATEVLEEQVASEDVGKDSKRGKSEKPRFIPVKFHPECVERVQAHLDQTLIRTTRTQYKSPDGSIALVCAVSKEHNPDGHKGYWFAFHPHQKKLLEEADESYVAFGCGSPEVTLLIPFQNFGSWLEGMNVTTKEDRSYWHVLISSQDDNYVLHQKKGEKRIDLNRYLIVN